MKKTIYWFLGLFIFFTINCSSSLREQETGKQDFAHKQIQSINPDASGKGFKKTYAGFQPKNKETVVFLGDSITHRSLYTQYVENYYFTRYPDRRLNFYNAGVRGDRALDALQRFDEDVLPVKPTYTTVLLGMNDGQYRPFDPAVFKTYKDDMTTLMDRLEQSGSQVIVMAPTVFDFRALVINRKVKPEGVRDLNYNSVLAFYGAWVLEMAESRGLGFVDMFEPLNRITRNERKKNPNFTLIPDAIHPGPDGQAIMAAALLTGIGAETRVSEILVSRKAGKWEVQTKNGKAENLRANTIDFTFKAKALPWVVPDEARKGFRLAQAGQRLGRETFRAVGLEPGDYELLIDGVSVGVYSYIDLAKGIALQGNTKTPQFQQAKQIAGLNRKRNKRIVKQLRNLWAERKNKKFGSAHINPNPKLDSEAFNGWEAEFKSKARELQRRSDSMVDEIYKLNKPKPLRYQLIRK